MYTRRYTAVYELTALLSILQNRDFIIRNLSYYSRDKLYQYNLKLIYIRVGNK